MNKFDTSFRGYNKEQVKNYLDHVIKQYENLLNEKKAVDKQLEMVKERLAHYENIESTLNRAIMTAETAGDEIKRVARTEAESLINEAKRNANRIINDALLKAEKAQSNTDKLRRNIILYKNRLRSIIESQLEIIEEIDKIDFRRDE